MSDQKESKSIIGGLLRRVFLISAIVMAISVVIAIALQSKQAAISIGSGWVIGFVSFFVLVMTVMKSFSGEHVKSVGWAIVGILKLGVLGGVLWLLITRGHVEPFSFMGGFSILVFALIIEGVRLNCGKADAI
ncbi:MAG: hypothetical protein HN337_05340 [Deltaproteobacteria bacterium]|jgi:hypothetical protein|nr:hypothetical protein [Deltaproteobacteria bacterium]